MAISWESTRLDLPHGDGEGVLAHRDGRLFAILSCLGDIHGDLLGHWYVEVSFAVDLVTAGQVFANLERFEEHVGRDVN